MKHSSLWMIFKKFIYSYGVLIKSLYGHEPVRVSKQSGKMQQVVQKESQNCKQFT